MSRFTRQILSFALAALCLTSSIPCLAASPAVNASAYVLIDAGSGRVLLARNETAEMAIASTTKIMTALVALEHAGPGELVTVKESHLKEGSSMYLRAGERLTMEELLYGLMLPSGNDAAECIADYCGGGTEQFVAWMNEKAAALGMAHTAFANPSGLDAEGHHSCALDMARLAAYAMQNPTFLRIVSTRSASAGDRSWSNHNKLLVQYDGCIGLKTGYTSAAGRTLVTCVERGGLRLVAVTLRDGSDWADHTALYDYGFSAYRRAVGVKRAETCAAVAVRGGAATSVRAVAAEEFAYPAAADEELTRRIEVVDETAAPVAARQKLGEAVFLLDGQEVGRTELLAANDVAAAPQPARKQGIAGLFSLFSRS